MTASGERALKRPRGRPPGTTEVDPAAVERGRALVAAGRSIRAAAAEVGLSKTTLSRHIGPTGSPRGRRPGIPDELAARLVSMRESGMPYRRIAAILDIPKTTVERALRRMSGAVRGSAR